MSGPHHDAAPKRERVDVLLVARGLCASRELARRLILAGEVRSGDTVLAKPGMRIAGDAPLAVRRPPRFVGRGGHKLEAALDAFGIDPAGRVCLDIGSSTGGFTDCLLQRGAARVHALDVGTNQLVWKLRSDPRVVVHEKFNARNLTPDLPGEPVSLIVIDVSFISLTHVLPPAFTVLAPAGDIVCLIKPQFELARDQIGKGGVVRDPALHHHAIDKIHAFVAGPCGRTWRGWIESPLTGADGNREFLAWLG
jgi:23S rRNA (cytidine1920-2'-O)/16S rRNA (cytidine1409-2'-O)-methyltransferase